MEFKAMETYSSWSSGNNSNFLNTEWALATSGGLETVTSEQLNLFLYYYGPETQ